MDVAGVITLLTALFSAVGLWNLVLIAIILILVFNSPTIINIILRQKTKEKEDKAKILSADTLQTFVLFIKEAIAKLQKTAEDNSRKLDFNKTIIEQDCNQTVERAEAQHEENVLMANTLSKVADTLASIDDTISSVMTENDTKALISSKLGIVENLKNQLLYQIVETIDSNPGRKNGQLKADLKNDLDNIWIDFKESFRGFNTPVNIKYILDKIDLWANDGMYSEIMNLATSDLSGDRRNEAISKLIDLEIRKVQLKINSALVQIKNEGGQYGTYNFRGSGG
jgi:hypothetical protein